MVLLEGLRQLQDSLLCISLQWLGLYSLFLVDEVSSRIHFVDQSWSEGAGTRGKRRDLDFARRMPSFLDFVSDGALPWLVCFYLNRRRQHIQLQSCLLRITPCVLWYGSWALRCFWWTYQAYFQLWSMTCSVAVGGLWLHIPALLTLTCHHCFSTKVLI